MIMLLDTCVMPEPVALRSAGNLQQVTPFLVRKALSPRVKQFSDRGAGSLAVQPEGLDRSQMDGQVRHRPAGCRQHGAACELQSWACRRCCGSSSWPRSCVPAGKRRHAVWRLRLQGGLRSSHTGPVLSALLDVIASTLQRTLAG